MFSKRVAGFRAAWHWNRFRRPLLKLLPVGVALGCVIATGVTGARAGRTVPYQVASRIGSLNPFDRLTALAARRKAAVWKPTLQRQHTATVPVRYSITALSPCPNQVYEHPAAINQRGQILLNDVYRGSDGGCYPYAGTTGPYVVNRDGTGLYLATCCAVQGINNQSSLTAGAINNRNYVVGAFFNYAFDVQYPISDFVEWMVIGTTDSQVVNQYAGSGQYDVPLAINDLGIAVGYDVPSENTGYGVAAAFVKNTVVPLRPLPNSDCSNAAAINNNGKVVGLNSLVDCSAVVATVFTLDGRPARTLPLKSVPSVASAVNCVGDIVGTAGNFAFLDRDRRVDAHCPPLHPGNSGAAGGVSYLPLPSGYSSSTAAAAAYGLNDQDAVVGDVDIIISGSRQYPIAGFLYQNGRTYDLNTLLPPNSGWDIFDAAAINDAGEIIGEGTYEGVDQPYLLKPIGF